MKKFAPLAEEEIVVQGRKRETAVEVGESKDAHFRGLHFPLSAPQLKENQTMQKIIPCLWFNDNAEEAVMFYTSIFKNSKITGASRYGEGGAKASGRPKGTVMTITFQLDGQEFMALNGGPHFTFSPAISFMANCKTQKEIDVLWEKLSAGGKIEQCGWLKDKYGVSWQIVPTVIGKMMQDKDGNKTDRVMRAILQMKKLDIETLKRAYLRGK